ncbi:phage integrase SAM-like domain-containing protein, partial [Bacteroides sp. KG122]|uniref:phage integrase SAM-like domain-containing protein n=1 Tax=Bacteroides sp. KG122 TaxID=3397827 RepID=UPI003D999B12
GKSRSTAGNYRTAVRSFVRFNSGRDVPLSALSAETLRRYERWLRERGVCPNTSSCYMRSLRAVYNKAAARRLVKDKAPFKGVFTGNEKTVKRSIGAEEIRRLKSLSSFPPPCGGGKEKEAAPASGAFALDLFLFSFYSMGMPFADLA